MICNNCGNVIETYNRFCPKCGAPVQFQPAAPMPPPAGAGFPQSPMIGGPAMQAQRGSSGCGKILLIVGIIIVLLAGGIAAAVYFGYRYAEKSLKSSEAYTAAVAALKKNPEVKEKLGEITSTGFPLGSYSQHGDGSGNATFVMSVQGTKTTGHYEVSLLRRNSIWHLESGMVRTASGDIIQISENSDQESTNANRESTEVNENVNARGAIRGGLLNAKATSLPKPSYPPIAKTAKVAGSVTVQVLVDENGNVIAARAISGHPLLQSAAVAAARQAKFAPTKVKGKPVKVSGTIVYNFTL